MPEMIIRSGKESGAHVIYAAGRFENQKYIVSQASGATPFGSVLCCPGSNYVVEMAPDGVTSSHLGKIQLVSSASLGKAWYLKDTQSGEVWSAFYNPVCSGSDEYEVSYSPGQVRVFNLQNKIACTLTVAVSLEHPCEIWHVKLENRSAQDRTLRFATYVEPAVDTPLETRHIKQDRLLLMRRPLESAGGTASFNAASNLVLFHSSTLPVSLYQVEKAEFVGSDRSLANPMGLEVELGDETDGIAANPVASLAVDIDLPIEGEAEFGFCFGATSTAEEASQIAQSLSRIDSLRDAVDSSRTNWERLCSSLKLQSGDPTLDSLINTWLPYEAYSCWAKAHAENMTCGAQNAVDSMRRFQPLGVNAAFAFRESLIDFAGRLSTSGEYHHDDLSQTTVTPPELLCFAICAASYVAETGNTGALSQTVTFVDGVVMSLAEHCERAIRHCVNNNDGHLNNELLERALEAWSFVRPSDEFAELLEKVRNRRAYQPNEYPEQRSLPRRMRYLQSICPTLSDTGISDTLAAELDESSSDARSAIAAYRAVTEKVLGIMVTKEGLVIRPYLPESWLECNVTRIFRGDVYNIKIKRSASCSKKGVSIIVDGEPVLGEMLPVFGDGGEHQVNVTVG